MGRCPFCHWRCVIDATLEVWSALTASGVCCLCCTSQAGSKAFAYSHFSARQNPPCQAQCWPTPAGLMVRPGGTPSFEGQSQLGLKIPQQWPADPSLPLSFPIPEMGKSHLKTIKNCSYCSFESVGHWCSIGCPRWCLCPPPAMTIPPARQWAGKWQCANQFPKIEPNFTSNFLNPKQNLTHCPHQYAIGKLAMISIPQLLYKGRDGASRLLLLFYCCQHLCNPPASYPHLHGGQSSPEQSQSPSETPISC